MTPEQERASLNRRRFLKAAAAGVAGAAAGAAGARQLFAQEDDGDGEETKAGHVKRRPLGKTGIQGSVIAFGCGGIRTDHLALLQKAHERGVNLFDTAWGYGGGRSEEGVGALVEAVKDRESIVIITKTTGFRPPRGSSKELYEALEEAIRESLARLKTEYIDVLYHPHNITSPAQLRNEQMNEALAKLKEKGLVRHLGCSSHSNYVTVGEAAIDDTYTEVYMPVANICTQNPDKAGGIQPDRRGRTRGLEDTRDLLKAAGKKKVGIVAMKVANGGYLGDRTDDLLAKAFPEDSEFAGLSRHQKLYRYMLDQEGVSSVVVGIHSAKHLMEALEVGAA